MAAQEEDTHTNSIGSILPATRTVAGSKPCSSVPINELYGSPCCSMKEVWERCKTEVEKLTGSIGSANC